MKLNDRGQGLTEYLILVFLIAIISIGAVKTMGATVKRKVQTMTRHIESDVVLEENN